MITQMILFVIVAIILYLYSLRGIFIFTRKIKNIRIRKNIILSYWLLDVAFIVFSIFWIIIIRTSEWPDFVKYRNYFYISGAFSLIYFPKFAFVPFVFLNDLRSLFILAVKRVNFPGNRLKNLVEKKSKFNVLLSFGILCSTIVFFLVIYGIVIGKSNFKVTEKEIYFENLPPSFDGLVLAHISDTHLGGFSNKGNVYKGIEKIAKNEPDIVLFTGDLINNQAKEGKPYAEAFNKLTPQLGKYSVLGNHDIGDYRRWYMIEDKDPDIKSVEDLHEQMGFELLRNNNTFIIQEDDSIMIAGVDSWGLPPFEKTGDLSEAVSPYNDFNFIVLLTHDPTHWSEEVLGKENIRLTLSGHTHGIQFGVTYGNIKWSPAKYIYEYWYGLYKHNNQYLYVNPGFGFVGLPLRVVMPPEITIITLKSGDGGK